MYFGPPEDGKRAKERVAQRLKATSTNAKAPVPYDASKRMHNVDDRMAVRRPLSSLPLFAHHRSPMCLCLLRAPSLLITAMHVNLSWPSYWPSRQWWTSLHSHSTSRHIRSVVGLHGHPTGHLFRLSSGHLTDIISDETMAMGGACHVNELYAHRVQHSPSMPEMGMPLATAAHHQPCIHTHPHPCRIAM
jgi:hypothetical protein